ncbi:hypothetical protein BP6252_10984 [Coleophoma cylindrospora]|uniref:Uncharacterized protein n=1 Tax=Coleophoma cylindrospora TaxID=1849047 RepID=A0A3D8QNS1_9HELO|nr:hypothetical protein BP6252_10984 [Coleophoma cylindrospora]
MAAIGNQSSDEKALLSGYYQALDEKTVPGTQSEFPRHSKWTCQQGLATLFKTACLIAIAVLMIPLFVIRVHRYNDLHSFLSNSDIKIHDELGSDPPAQCLDNSTASFHFDFNRLQNFTLTEVFNLDRSFSASERYLRSNIRLLPASFFQAQDILVKASVTSNNLLVLEQLQHEVSDSSLAFTIPVPRNDEDLCLVVNLDLYVRTSLSLENLNIFSTLANVEILLPPTVRIRNEANINIDVGAVTALPFPSSHKTRIYAGAGAILGVYTINDLLMLNTTSGTISVDVAPNPMNRDSTTPAEFFAKTTAGSMNISYPPPQWRFIPKRPYEVTVVSGAGLIEGRFLHGRKTHLESSAGNMVASILPFYMNTDDPSWLRTQSVAGDQKITILAPHYPKIPLAGFTSTHKTGIGRLELQYPDEWEGSMRGETAMGSVIMNGTDVEIIDQGTLWPAGHYVKAIRGDGDNHLTCSAGTGSVFANVG